MWGVCEGGSLQHTELVVKSHTHAHTDGETSEEDCTHIDSFSFIRRIDSTEGNGWILSVPVNFLSCL